MVPRWCPGIGDRGRWRSCRFHHGGGDDSDPCQPLPVAVAGGSHASASRHRLGCTRPVRAVVPGSGGDRRRGVVDRGTWFAGAHVPGSRLRTVRQDRVRRDAGRQTVDLSQRTGTVTFVSLEGEAWPHARVPSPFGEGTIQTSGGRRVANITATGAPRHSLIPDVGRVVGAGPPPAPHPPRRLVCRATPPRL